MNTLDTVIHQDRKKILTTYSCPVCSNSSYLEIVHAVEEKLEVTATCPRCRILSVHYKKEDEGHRALPIHDFRNKSKNGNTFTTV